MNVFQQHLAQFRHCLECSYPLRGLQSETRNCPECGATFQSDIVVIQAIPERERASWLKNPLLDVLVVVACVLLIPVLPPFLTVVALAVALVAILAVILNGISFIARLGRRNRQADGCLVLTDELATFVRNGERKFSLRWSAATRYLIRRISHGRWRVRLSSRVASVDVIIAADKRTIAAIRAELKSRTGHIGMVAWGTSIRRNVVNS